MKANNRDEPLSRRSFLAIGILGVAGLLTVGFDLLAVNDGRIVQRVAEDRLADGALGASTPKE